ncbi:MAG TPA: hypothetical protein PL010_14770 [Flavobacteriales bacterium]|nr:hypothetical protein [Flavobacteriales bacterium]HNA33093.1 hypothetical protein [Flavobacteriales bacterium]HNI05884.1 hypothetical protein [Flavobacteriales bacterium]HNK40936.1 hypothetical protein [Flavobacteriales bacterium]HNK70150.1 hypothetical protein [Flavobacteriales bacterium]
MNRKAFLYLFVGTNGTGKTTRAKDLLDINPRNLIVPSNRLDSAWSRYPELAITVEHEDDPMNPGKQRRVVRCPEMASFTGTRVLHIDNPAKLQAITDERFGFRNGLLFIDDFRNRMPHKGDLPSDVLNMLTGRRHRMLDIALAMHSFQDMNLQLMQFQPELFIFRTTLPPNDAVEGKVADWQGLVRTANRVNDRAKDNRYYFEHFIPA